MEESEADDNQPTTSYSPLINLGILGMKIFTSAITRLLYFLQGHSVLSVKPIPLTREPCSNYGKPINVLKKRVSIYVCVRKWEIQPGKSVWHKITMLWMGENVIKLNKKGELRQRKKDKFILTVSSIIITSVFNFSKREQVLEQWVSHEEIKPSIHTQTCIHVCVYTHKITRASNIYQYC